jgi:hypothetical protein
MQQRVHTIVSYGILCLCGISWSCSSSACDGSGGASRQPLLSENLLAPSF